MKSAMWWALKLYYIVLKYMTCLKAFDIQAFEGVRYRENDSSVTTGIPSYIWGNFAEMKSFFKFYRYVILRFKYDANRVKM